MSELAAIIIAIAASLGAVLTLVNTILGLRNKAAIHEVKVAIDGRLSELLALTRSSSHAEGMAQEKQDVAELAAGKLVS